MRQGRVDGIDAPLSDLELVPESTAMWQPGHAALFDIGQPISSMLSYLEQPVMRVHVLLDRKGKTLSHAFVEVSDEKIARAVLRGEGTRTNPSGGARMRSSNLSISSLTQTSCGAWCTTKATGLGRRVAVVMIPRHHDTTAEILVDGSGHDYANA